MAAATRPVACRLALAVLLIATLAALAGAQAPEIVARARPAVAIIEARVARGVSRGTGFVYDATGFLATALHVVEGATEIVVRLPDRQPMLGVVVQSSPTFDLAVLRLPQSGLPFLPLAAGLPRPGEEILVLGYPLASVLGFEDLTVTRGVVSRVLTAEGLLQLDASVNPGNSGGPVLNLRGEVVGVVRARLKDAVGINFATLVGPLTNLAQLARGAAYVAPSPAPISPPPTPAPTPVAPTPAPTPAPAPTSGPDSGWILIGEKGPQVRRPEIRSEPNWALRAARVRREGNILLVQIELHARLTGDSYLGVFWRLPGSRLPRWGYRIRPDGRVFRVTVSPVREQGRDLLRFETVDSRARTVVTGSVVDLHIPVDELRESDQWEVYVHTCWVRDRICENVDWFSWFLVPLR